VSAPGGANVEDGSTVADTLGRGKVRFLGLELVAAPGALVARKETETLGEKAVELVRERTAASGPQLVIDMCTGSGNLACAIAKLVPGTRVHASDLTAGCVSVARRNVEALGLGASVTVHQGDLFAPLAGDASLLGEVDVVVCNPPYISTGKLEKDRAELLDTEPREAFDGGPYGISIHQRVVRDALAFLRPGGMLCFEIGAGQARQVILLFTRAKDYEPVVEVTDQAGEVRVLYAKKKLGEAKIAETKSGT
jgi:HemK-like putative methylase